MYCAASHASHVLFRDACVNDWPEPRTVALEERVHQVIYVKMLLTYNAPMPGSANCGSEFMFT